MSFPVTFSHDGIPIFNSIGEKLNSDDTAFAAQVPRVLWLTGLSGAGKTTIANALHRELTIHGIKSVVLDGDAIRNGMNADLGFTPTDRAENIRRIAHLAHLLRAQGFLVIVSVISPAKSQRQSAKNIIGDHFFEIFVHAPLTVCELRDPKGLYAKARNGTIRSFTGVSEAYENPDAPDLVLATDQLTIEQCVNKLACLISSSKGEVLKN